MSKELIFKIVTGDRERPETHHEYRIYDDGSIEGFENVIYIRNNHFAIVNQLKGEICEVRTVLLKALRCAINKIKALENDPPRRSSL